MVPVATAAQKGVISTEQSPHWQQSPGTSALLLCHCRGGEDGGVGSALQDRSPPLLLAVLTLPLKQDFCCPCLLSSLSWLSSGFNQPKNWNEPVEAARQLGLPDCLVVPHRNLNVTHEYCFRLGRIKIYFVLHMSGSGKSGLGG